MAAKKKTAKDKRSRPARRVAIRQLNDPRRWWRLTKVRTELLPHLGKHTTNDLMKELKGGRFRCVRRIETDAKYAHDVPTRFWRSLQWPAKLFFDRLGKYDPEFYVWRPWEVWPKLQAPEASKTERKRAKGGGAKSMYTDEEKERGEAAYRKMLRDDPGWRSASQESVALHVQTKAKLLGCPRTVYRNIIKPVNAELE
jgi:hypothetical protein